MVEIELDDDLLDEPRPPRRPWPLRRLRWIATALAAVLVVATAVDGHRAASVAAMSAGLVADLTVPRHELWRVAGNSIVGVAGNVLVVADDGLGSFVAGVSVDDGTEIWRVSDPGSCAMVDLDSAGDTFLRVSIPSTRIAEGRARLVCQSWGVSGYGETRATVVDPATGAVILELPAGAPARQVISAGRHLVVASDGGSSGSTMVGWSLETGAREWAVAGPGASRLDTAWLYTGVLVIGVDSDRLIGLDPATGADRDLTPDDLLVGRRDLAGGGTVATRLPDRGSSWPTVVGFDPDGAVRWEVSGIGLLPGGAPAPVAVVPVYGPDGRTVGVDARTGETVWTGGDAMAAPILQTAGVLVVADMQGSGNLSVIDERSGAVLWTAEAAASLEGKGLANDGDHLALVETIDGQRSAVVRDLKDGSVVARWPLPLDGTSTLQALPDGRLAQVGTSQIAVLGR
jgi:outer membrane protein assembly factor BamB